MTLFRSSIDTSSAAPYPEPMPNVATFAIAKVDDRFHWTIETQTDIEASPERVWEVLLDLGSYRRWNPFIIGGEGNFSVGERVKLEMRTPGSSAGLIEPLVVRATHATELRWRGRLGLPGLVDGEHYFELEPNGVGGTRFVHGEYLSGVLLPMLGEMHEEILASFLAMDAALRIVAESD